MPTVALIACCGAKLEHRAPARQLYTSPLFRKSVAWAERNAAAWAILSAAHGLLMPDDRLDPYDVTLATMAPADRRAWCAKVRAQLAERFPAGTTFAVLAGRHYARAVEGLPHVDPLAGMGIGRRLQFLGELLDVDPAADAIAAAADLGAI